MKIVIFTSSRETEFEEPVFCDRDSVKVDASKCTGKSISIAPHLAHFAKYLKNQVVVVDPFADETHYEADKIIGDVNFSVPDDEIKGAYSVVATKHVYDSWAITKSLGAGAKAVWVVMSPKRAKVVLKRLVDNGLSKDKLKALRLPAGLDIKAENEEEIALSIIAEIIAYDRGGTGRPLSEIKNTPQLVDSL
ncbi:hypothetical protein HS7_03950 [Sulfolobales archaeon HS-7]|nr:hypothetical protein HS7_03950 [Sulfolobales archaeon HS-7]